MPARSRSRLGRFALRLLLAIVITIFLFGLIAYLAVTRYALVAPTWWQPPSAADPRTVETARTVENGVTTVLHQQHAPDQTFTMSLSGADANAWLAARLKEWVANQDGSFSWPSDVSSLQVDFREGQVVFGMGVMYRGVVRVVSLSITPRVDEKGQLWLPASDFAIGKLSVPSSFAESVVRSSLPASASKSEGTTKVFDALAGKAPISANPVLKLSDGRRVKVVGIRSEAGRLLVTCKPAVVTQ